MNSSNHQDQLSSLFIFGFELILILIIIVIIVYVFLDTRHVSYLFLFLGEVTLLISYTIQFYDSITIPSEMLLRAPYFLIMSSIALWIVGIKLFSYEELGSYSLWVLIVSGFTSGAILFDDQVIVEQTIIFHDWYIRFPMYVILLLILLNLILTYEIFKQAYYKKKSRKVKLPKRSFNLMIAGTIVYLISFVAVLIIYYFDLPMSLHLVYLLGWFVWSLGVWQSPLILIQSYTKPLSLHVIDNNNDLSIFSHYFSNSARKEYNEEKLLLLSKTLTQASEDMFNMSTDLQLYIIEADKVMLKRKLNSRFDVLLVSRKEDEGLRAAFNYFCKLLKVYTWLFNELGDVIYFENIDLSELVEKSFNTITFITPKEKPLKLNKPVSVMSFSSIDDMVNNGLESIG